MRKKILLMLSAFCFMGATVFGQAIEGGAGVIHVNGDPNLMLTMDDLSVNEGHIAYDRTTGIAYFFDPAGTNFATNTPLVGTQWIALDISNLVDPITSIIVDAAGTPELTATTVAGVTTLSFESDATISYVPATNIFTFTDVDGDDTDIDLSELDDIVQAETGNASITVTGDGSSGTPYEISLTGADTGGNSGYVPVTDGSGTLTWTNVVEDVSVTSDGQLQLTMTDGSTANIDLDSAPKVANKTELDAEIATLTAAAVISGNTETGIAIAADNNTFGMPADTDFGVIFFIKSN